MPAPTTARPPLLELSTLQPIDRPFITIDGAPYELNTEADFSLLSLNKLDQQAAQVRAMQQRQDGPGPLSDADTVELTEALKVVVAQIVRAPAEVLDRLNDIHRFAILTSFMPASQDPSATPAKPKRNRRTGASSSRASRGSTTATPAG